MTKRTRRLTAMSVAAFTVLSVSACDQGLTEVNENPNAPETVPVANVLLGGIWDVAANGGNRGYFGQWTQLYSAENWAQHIAQPVYNDEDKYTPRGGIPEAIWSEMYYALLDLSVAKDLSDGVDDNIWAIAEIMSVYGFMTLTDYFGDIPYTEALRLDEGITAPAYDAQSAIYPDLIARLVAAAARIDLAATTTFGDFDPVYQGDMDGWLRFANSLQLRLAMRMVNRDAAGAQAAFQAAWAQTIFTDVDEMATVDWTGSNPSANPVYEGIVLAGRLGDFRMSESLVDRMAAFNDPRLPIYAEPTVIGSVYRGLPNGTVPSDFGRGASDYSTIGSYFLGAATPSNLMSYAEMLFLGAEAAERGWAVGSTAAALYDEAITASMDELGVGAGPTATYLGEATVDYATGTYTGLDAIWVQKWIALFLAGPEAFTEMRRVGWLDLTPAANSVLGAGQFPARLNYPSDEALYNPDNYPSTPPVITDPVWWAN
jgi:hypothetical protein